LNRTHFPISQENDPDKFKPLRICLLGYRSKPHCGGQGVYIKYLSSALTKLGHSVDVISGEPYPELDDNVKLIKMPGLNLFEKEGRLTTLRFKYFLSSIDFFEWFSVLTGGFPEPFTFGKRLEKFLQYRQHEYDLVHDNQSLCYGLLYLQSINIPVVATIHHPITKDRIIALNSSRNWWHRILIRRWHSFLNMQGNVVRKLDHLLTVSEQSRKDILQAFRIPASKISTVFNGIDTDDFAPMPDVKRLPFQLIATASADVPLKGLDYLLKALASLKDRYPALELLVIGSRKPGGHTDELINKLRLNNKIRFVTNLTTEEIKRLYAESTIAVVPSLYEGFGLPAGEAMSCGIPVISTNGGALPEVVGEAGIQVPIKDSPALASAIANLLKNPDKREKLGAAGRNRILEKFSWDVAAKQMTRYYNKLLQNANN